MPARELQEQLNTLREQLEQNPPLTQEERDHLTQLATQIQAQIDIEKATNDTSLADSVNLAVERFEVFQRHLEEGELVALEILGEGEAEHRLRGAPEGVQHLDPEIDVAVRLRPHALGVVQRMRPVSLGVGPGEDGGHAQS